MRILFTVLDWFNSLLSSPAERERLRRFDSRENLTADLLFTQYFAHLEVDRDVTMGVLDSVANAIGTQPGKLRPSDSLDGVLSLAGSGWDDGVNLIFSAIEQENRKIEPEYCLNSLAELVRAYSRQQRNRKVLGDISNQNQEDNWRLL